MSASSIKKQFLEKSLLIVGSLVFCELLLRVLGFQPYINSPFKLESEPAHFLAPSDTFGYALSQGSFNVNINGLRFKTSHISGNRRIVMQDSLVLNAPKINVYGCSFMYGFGLSDSATASFKLQKLENPNFCVQSFAVPGHGNVQGYLKLKQQIENNKKPDVAIFGFCYFHPERNVLNPSYRIHIKDGLKDENINSRFPFVENEDGNFKINYEKTQDIYSHWYLRKNLSIVNLFQTSYDLIFKSSNGVEETQWLFSQTKKLCEKNDIKLIIAPLTRHENMATYIEFFEENDFHLANTILNIDDKEYNNLPHDTHPNGKATDHFSINLLRAVNQTLE